MSSMLAILVCERKLQLISISRVNVMESNKSTHMEGYLKVHAPTVCFAEGSNACRKMKHSNGAFIEDSAHLSRTIYSEV